MRERHGVICLFTLLAVLALLLAACGVGKTGKQVTIKCDDCDTVELWETSHATRVVGEVKPGEKGTFTDKAWNALEGRTFYYVVVGDKEGWVREEDLAFE
ncbi:MAG: hypothetical protein PVF54_06980 [Anaerolineae bacterium]|jgi:hypothetical protein